MSKCNPAPNDIVLIDGDHIGRSCGVTYPALVAAVDGDEVCLRTFRCPTRAEEDRGDYDRFTKRTWRVHRRHIIGPAPEQEASDG